MSVTLVSPSVTYTMRHAQWMHQRASPEHTTPAPVPHQPAHHHTSPTSAGAAIIPSNRSPPAPAGRARLVATAAASYGVNPPEVITPPAWGVRTMPDIDPTRREQADEHDTRAPRWRLPIIVIGVVAAMLLWLLLTRIIPKSHG